MKLYLRYAYLISALAIMMLDCGLLSDIVNLAQDAEELLPLAPIGGTPIQVVANVELDYREIFAGSELVYSAGEWTHKQEGRLLNTLGWLPHLDQIEAGTGGGRLHCCYDWGRMTHRHRTGQSNGQANCGLTTGNERLLHP